MICIVIFVYISIITIEISFLSFSYNVFIADLILNFGSAGILSAFLCIFLFEEVFENEKDFPKIQKTYKLIYIVISLIISLVFGYYWMKEWNTYFIIVIIPMINNFLFFIVSQVNLYLRFHTISTWRKSNNNYKIYRKKGLFVFILLEMLCIQLLLTFNYGKLYEQVEINFWIIAILCSLYPVVIGIIKQIVLIVSKKSGLSCEAFIEYISFTFAGLPYKTIYFQIATINFGFMVLAIKTTYKIITYVILPFQPGLLKKLYQLTSFTKNKHVAPFSYSQHIKKFNYLQFTDSQNNINVYFIVLICRYLVKYDIISDQFNDSHFEAFTIQSWVEFLLDIFLWIFIPKILKLLFKGLKQKSFVDSFYDEILSKYKVLLSIMFLSYIIIFFMLTH